jgi:hypothetical protein
METILVVFTLAVKSSYARNVEVDAAGDEFDTVQFYFGGVESWRIKTYAMDQDVHAWNIGKVEDLVALARANTEKHYGDVLAERYILRSESGLDGIRLQLTDRGLDDHLELSNAGFVFWTPKGTTYRTKSRPDGA